MKKLIGVFVLLLITVFGFSQGVPIRGDSIIISKACTGCNADLIVKNSTRDSLGFAMNVGGGKFKFFKPVKINDSQYVIGPDTLKVGSVTDSAIFYTKYRSDTSRNNLYAKINLKVDSVKRKLASDSVFYYRSGGVKVFAFRDSTTDTTSLNLRLNLKVDSVKRKVGSDSVFYFRNGTQVFAFKDSTGAGALPLLPGHIFAGNTLSVATDTPFVNDDRILAEIKTYTPAIGLGASSNITNYTPQTVDQMKALFSTSRTGTSPSTDFGGWLAASTSGDSIRLTAPIGVLIGNSIMEGHPGLHGRLHPNGTVAFQSNYPDSVGQLSYHLRALTNMRWYNQGIGGQTSTQVRARFMRDAIGIDANPNDSRGSVSTLPHTPSIIVIECGINDVVNAGNVPTLQANLLWMASACSDYGIPFVVFNLPGDQVSSQQMLKDIVDMNRWLASGALNVYGATVYNFNAWWNGSSTSSNVVGNGLLADDIHPTKAGYDSLSRDLFSAVKLPVLNKAIFINEIAPGFVGYSRPASISINGISGYTITKSTDTLLINSYVGDSLWIKVLSSTNVSGTTNSGFSSILFGLSNNPTNQIWYTRRSFSHGTQQANINASSIKIQSISFGGVDVTNYYFPDGTAAGRVNIGPAANFAYGANTILLDKTGLASVMSVTGAITATLGVKGNANSQFGNLEVGNSATPGTTGYGIGQYSARIFLETTNGWNEKFWSTTSPLVASNVSFHIIAPSYTSLTTSQNNSVSVYSNEPVINNTANGFYGTFRGFLFKPTVTSQNGFKIRAYENTVGDNFFNSVVNGSRTIYGDTTLRKGSSLVEMNSIKQGLLPPRMTTAQRDSIGYISSISVSGGSWTVAPSITFSGGTGSGLSATPWIVGGTSLAVEVINPGVGYIPATTVTGTFVGGTGSGGTITVNITGPDSGLVIFNTTIQKLQFYNGGSWVDVGLPSSNAGQTTLIAGTKAITITGLTTSSIAFVQLVSQGGTVTTTVGYEAVCTTNTLTINAITNAGSNALNTLDTSIVNYLIAK